MDVEIHSESGTLAVVHPVGRVDLLSAPDLRRALTETVLSGKCRLIVDLNDVPFIDSSGLAALISGLKAARLAGGDLRVARATDQAQNVFRLTKLDRVLQSYQSVEDASAGY